MKNAKKLSIIVIVLASSLSFASTTRNKLFPLPAPIPTSCPGDVLCW